MRVFPEHVYRPIGILLNRSTELRHSKVKYKFIFYKESSPSSPSSLLKLPIFYFSTTRPRVTCADFRVSSTLHIPWICPSVIYCRLFRTLAISNYFSIPLRVRNRGFSCISWYYCKKYIWRQKGFQNCSVLLNEFHFNSPKRKQTRKKDSYNLGLTLLALALRKICLHKNCTIYNFYTSFK